MFVVGMLGIRIVVRLMIVIVRMIVKVLVTMMSVVFGMLRGRRIEERIVDAFVGLVAVIVAFDVRNRLGGLARHHRRCGRSGRHCRFSGLVVVAVTAEWLRLGRIVRKGRRRVGGRRAVLDDRALHALAMAAAAAIVFVIALIVVTVITMKIADWIIDSRVGALDRTLGFLYGAARGILVVAVGLLFFNWLAGERAPGWLANAKSKPLLESVGTWLESILPEDPENAILNRLNPDQPATGTDATPPAPEEGTAPEAGAAPEGGTATQDASPPAENGPAGQPPANN